MWPPPNILSSLSFLSCCFTTFKLPPSMNMMDSSGFSSPRTNYLSVGLRVLVVDDDPTWLKILEKMLKKCNYQVTTCNLAREALKLLRERKDGFDIVISDVNMPDMNGFKLLEHVGLEMDLPVIMMSVDGETSRVMKGVQHGACDYLLKPIRMKELRNIWQHVFRKRIHEMSLEEFQRTRSRTEQCDMFSGYLVSGKKRRDVHNKHNDKISSDPFSVKRARVVWTVDLHQKFVKAVNQIGFGKVGPKKILDLMGVPWLTRENVASHLQKYRLYLSRLQKKNELKAAFGGITYSGISLTEPADIVCLLNPPAQGPTALQQNILPSENNSISGPKIPIQNDEPNISLGNMTGFVSESRTDGKNSLVPGVGNPSTGNTPGLTFDPCLDVESEPTVLVQYSWSPETPSIKFRQEQKPEFQLEHRVDELPLPKHQSIQFGTVIPTVIHNPGTSRYKSNRPARVTIKPAYDKDRSQSIDLATKADSTAPLLLVQSQNNLIDHHVIDPIPNPAWNTHNHILGQNLLDDLESYQRDMIAGTESTLKLWDEEFNDHSCQGEFFTPDACLGDIDPPDYTDQELIADVTPGLYGSLKFESDDPEDQVEYTLLDQYLFIA